MKEQTIQKNITRYLDSIGCYSVKIVAASKSGVPDILGCYKGEFFAIEVKKPSTRSNVSPLQEYNLKAIRTAGGYAIVAWGVGQVKEYFEEEIL